MTKFTIEDLIDIAYRGSYDDLERELALQLLASMEQEPVAYMTYKGYLLHADDPKLAEYSEPMPLYAAPQLPQPAVVPDAMEMDDDFDSAFEHGKAVGWNAYRAAMLQAEPVSNSDELPLDYLQGHKDGLEWAAQLAEANHPQTGDWLYDDQIDLARAIRKGPDMPTVQGGNSPVIPDGWVMVPVEPTIAILDEFDSIIDYGAEDSKDAWSRLLAAAWIKSLPAAPRQEVNRG